MTKRELILTADDYGFTRGINRGIEASVAASSLTSVCVMTNMPYWHDISNVALQYPDLSIGIHWTVTQGRPVLPVDKVSTLTTASGDFCPPAEIRRRARRRELDYRELEAELEAQLRCLSQAVPRVSFWNTHQNVHVTWPLYPIFVKIAEKLGVRAMRNHSRILVRGGRASLPYYAKHPLFYLKGLVLQNWSVWARRRGNRMPVARIADMEYGPGHSRILEALSGESWQGVPEAIFHPAADLDELESISSLQSSRLEEYRLLSASGFRDNLTAMGIEPVGFDKVI